MYVRIRDLSKKPGEQDTVITISKRSLIQELRKSIFEEMGVEVEKQRLFYKGKQLIDDHRVVEYDIHLNDVIQLMIKMDSGAIDSIKSNDDEISEATTASSSSSTLEKGESKYYRIKDFVDFMDPDKGAWFEGQILDIFKNQESPANSEATENKEPDLIFRIENIVDKGIVELGFDEIRPRAYHYYKPDELVLNQTVLANYNLENPNTRGYWYEYIITRKTSKFLQGTVLLGKNKIPYLDRTVKFMDEILRIETPKLLTERNNNSIENIVPRKTAYYCEKCKDMASRKCNECGCKICSGKNDSATIILCDECNSGYHIKCLNPPLSEIPTDPEWYCPDCKVDVNEIVKAGDKLKYSGKKAKMASAKAKGNKRDWGHGMATVGRVTECTIVPKDHYGPIPGIEVGTCWRFRVQVSEAGIHRPHVAGIHGRDNQGAYSLVLSGGYEDDVDNGDEFVYTGSGGRDLSGNKRVNEQSKDQVLTRMNRALALNCNTPLNEKGGEAKNWKGGKPVRVVRSYKLQSHSKYAPAQGIRYDGIYKVVKYYSEKGKSGYIVWKYVLRRDDPVPAPWEEGGQELEMIYPDGYIEAQQQKENLKAAANSEKRGVKRSAPSTSKSPSNKKAKIQPYKLDNELNEEILKDEDNKKLWDECKEHLNEGKKKFLEKVEELFMCVCCQELVYQPITMECKHNVCKACLKRSFASEIYNCPYCRLDLTKDFNMKVNESLQHVLLKLFSGYNANR